MVDAVDAVLAAEDRGGGPLSAGGLVGVAGGAGLGEQLQDP